ncbi:flagellar hook-associated family protein [Rhizobium sp. LjRoot30]|uniref:flagellar hook-associated family protein n=1 Tax=Rhizobium sp. LjRoot30 TaxID=3342320 RepID=UPI003ECFB109
MKTSFVSSLSIQNAMRLTVSQAQSELLKAQSEATTGKYYDLGVALAERTSQSLDLNREVARLKALSETNSLSTQRLASSQTALSNISDAGQSMLNTVLALSGSEDANSLKTARTSIENAFSIFADMSNMALNGEFLFAGINSDVQPATNMQTNVATAYNTELQFYLTSQGLTDKSEMSPAQMDSFLSIVETKFNGTSTLTDPPHTGRGGEDLWTSYVSQASDTNMTSRISKTEVVESSTNTNTQGMRYMALGAISALTFMDASLDTPARQAANRKMNQFIAAGIDGVDVDRGKLGLSEERIEKANDSLNAQQTIIKTYLGDLEGVDGYEAATRVKNLLALVDASYTLTARIQQLSLVNFL